MIVLKTVTNGKSWKKFLWEWMQHAEMISWANSDGFIQCMTKMEKEYTSV